MSSVYLTHSWWRYLSYRNQSIDLLCKSYMIKISIIKGLKKKPNSLKDLPGDSLTAKFVSLWTYIPLQKFTFFSNFRWKVNIWSNNLLSNLVDFISSSSSLHNTCVKNMMMMHRSWWWYIPLQNAKGSELTPIDYFRILLQQTNIFIIKQTLKMYSPLSAKRCITYVFCLYFKYRPSWSISWRS